MGDPAGIGPEVVCQAVAAAADGHPLEVIGDRAVFERCADELGLALPSSITVPDNGSLAEPVVPGAVSAACGAAAVAAVEHAIAGCLDGRYAGVVTAPLNKAAATAAGLAFPGHTELLAVRCGLGPDAVSMALVGGGLAVALVTCHVALSAVPELLTIERVVATTRRLHAARSRELGRPARLAVLGLNPHAGEGGLFGDEDQRVVEPAVAQLQAEGIEVIGPLPPDTAFTPAARRTIDGHVAMYHDQGLTTFKALAFDSGVNVTLGLPIIRTSPDHGTAFDIAWQGQAAPDAMLASIQLASALAAG